LLTKRKNLWWEGDLQKKKRARSRRASKHSPTKIKKKNEEKNEEKNGRAQQQSFKGKMGGG